MSADCRLTVTVRPARDAEEIEAAKRLRLQVFCEEQGVTREEELDGLDDEAAHIVALDDSGAGPGREAEEPALIVVATCRLRFEGATCKLERMAVGERFRKLGVGARLLAGAEAEALERGAERIVLHAQTWAQEFYAAGGYRSEGPLFMDARIEHVRMTKELSG